MEEEQKALQHVERSCFHNCSNLIGLRALCSAVKLLPGLMTVDGDGIIKSPKHNQCFQTNVTPEAFQTIYEWMVFNGVESNKLLKRDNILDLFCAAQYLAIKGITIKIILKPLCHRNDHSPNNFLQTLKINVGHSSSMKIFSLKIRLSFYLEKQGKKG